MAAIWSITGPDRDLLLAADTARTGPPVALNGSTMYIAGALGSALAGSGHWPIVTVATPAAVVAAGVSATAAARRLDTGD